MNVKLVLPGRAVTRAGGYVHDLMTVHLKDVSCNPCGLGRLSLDISVNNNCLLAVRCTTEGGISFTAYRAALGVDRISFAVGTGFLSSRFKRPVREANVSTPCTVYKCINVPCLPFSFKMPISNIA